MFSDWPTVPPMPPGWTEPPDWPRQGGGGRTPLLEGEDPSIGAARGSWMLVGSHGYLRPGRGAEALPAVQPRESHGWGWVALAAARYAGKPSPPAGGASAARAARTTRPTMHCASSLRRLHHGNGTPYVAIPRGESPASLSDDMAGADWARAVGGLLRRRHVGPWEKQVRRVCGEFPRASPEPVPSPGQGGRRGRCQAQ